MFNIIGPSSFLRMSFTHLLYLNTEFILSSTLIWITSKAPSQSHVLSHFFGPDYSMLGCLIAHFSALFLTLFVFLPKMISSNLQLSAALFAGNFKFTFSSPSRYLHWMLSKHLFTCYQELLLPSTYLKLLPPNTSYLGKWYHHSFSYLSQFYSQSSHQCLSQKSSHGLYLPVQFSSVQSLSHVRLFATPWIAAH